jgi:uncharacterized protein YjbI with pentapeptide repeats
MTVEKQPDLRYQSQYVWNEWRQKHPSLQPNLQGINLRARELMKVDLSSTDLSEANLSQAELTGANLSGANLSRADLTLAKLPNSRLIKADLSGANLNGADFSWSDLRGAIFRGTTFRGTIFRGAQLYQVDLHGADLSGVDLSGTNLNRVNLSGVNLSGANLSQATFVSTDLRDAKLTNCRVYGVSAWDVQLEGATQTDLIITPPDQPTITVDDLKVAQFIYTLLNNKNIRDVIDTVTKKVVLILGRFTPPRKVILDGLREELRKHNYLPVLFDFDKPASRDTIETMTTLAHLAHFIIADITNPRSIPGELVVIVRDLQSVPIQPLLRYGGTPWGMYDSIKRAPSVLKLHRYRNLNDLLLSFPEKVIEPAEAKARELKPQ